MVKEVSKEKVERARPGIAILLDKERHLKFDLNAMAAYEEATGESLLGGLAKESIGARQLRALLWACLIHEDEKLTLKEVGSWINTDNIEEISGRISAAFQSAIPESEESEESDPLASPPNG